VGRLQAEADVFHSFIMHWDGVAWSNIPVPSFGGDGGLLWSVDAIAPDDAWAVGSRGSRTVALHWDGSSWSFTRIVHPSSVSAFFDVAATGAGDVWAVGSSLTDAERVRPLAERWNGSTWERIGAQSATASDDGLAGVDAMGRHRWAVGFGRERGTEVAVIERSCGG